MSEKIRILFLSANPLPTGRILVDVEEREISERLQEGPYRDNFELLKHAAIQPIDIQKLLLKHRPHIVHFCGHGHKAQKIILGGTPGRAKTVDKQGLAQVFSLYSHHVRLVVLNACYTNTMARSITKAVDYAVGTGKGIGDKAGVAFAGALYRALGFGKSVKEAFASAKAELGLTRMPRAQGIELFVRVGLNERDSFPRVPTGLMFKRAGLRSACRITVFESLSITRCGERVYLRRQQYAGVQARCARAINRARLNRPREVTAAPGALNSKEKLRMPISKQKKQTIEQDSPKGRSPLANALRKPTPKAAGTRVGTLQDWRGATSGKTRRGRNQMRDGR
jgi:hypothetical protein